MNLRLHTFAITWIVAILAAACATQPSAPSGDAMATAVAQAAVALLTQTAAAASPTPPATATATPNPTNTIEPTSTVPFRNPQTVGFASCWLGGPGQNYPLDSHLNNGKAVEVVGTGSVPGWFIIRHPKFHNLCWILATELKVFPGTDFSTLPVMTPGP
jgi:hypothetical protein